MNKKTKLLTRVMCSVLALLMIGGVMTYIFIYLL